MPDVPPSPPRLSISPIAVCSSEFRASLPTSAPLFAVRRAQIEAVFSRIPPHLHNLLEFSQSQAAHFPLKMSPTCPGYTPSPRSKDVNSNKTIANIVVTALGYTQQFVPVVILSPPV